VRGDILRAKAVVKGLFGEWEEPEEELLEKWARDEELFFIDVAAAPTDIGILDEVEWVEGHSI